MLSGSGEDVSIGDTIIPADAQYSTQGFGVEGVEAKLLCWVRVHDAAL